MRAERHLLFTIVTLGILAVGALSVTAVVGAQGASCPASQTLGISALGGGPNSFNHLTANPAGGFGYYLMYLSLYPPSNPSGQQDTSRSITDWISSNSNNTVWIFNVKPGLKWSDGSPVTSTDIVNTFSKTYALNASYDLVGAGLEVKSTSVLNSSAAVFTLNAPDAHFAEKISDPVFTGVYPPSMISKGPAYDGFGATLVSDAPYYVQDYTSGASQAVFLKNTYSSPSSNACEVILNFPETLSQNPTLLVSGTADLAPVPPADVSNLLSHPNFHLALVPFHEATYLRYNVTTYPYNMTQFRQALAFGINQSQVLQQAFGGYGSTAYSAEGITPTSDPWYNPAQMQYQFSANQATSLLNSIGLTKGSDGFLQYKNGTDVSLTIFTDTANPEDPVAASVVSTNLEALGFKVNVNTVGLGALIGGSYANTGDEQHSILLWTSPGPDFGSSYVNAQPAYNANIVPMIPGNTWEYPPSVQQAYQGNLTVVDTTPSGSGQTQALNNIQAINSKYLPILMIAYPAETWIYSTAKWTNWPTSGTGSILIDSTMYNTTTLANLQPVSAASSTTATSTSAGSSATTTSTSTSSVAAPSDYTSYYVAGVIIVLVVAVAAWVFLRRKPKTS